MSGDYDDKPLSHSERGKLGGRPRGRKQGRPAVFADASEELLARYHAAAEAEGLHWAEWVRRTLGRRADEVLDD